MVDRRGQRAGQTGRPFCTGLWRRLVVVLADLRNEVDSLGSVRHLVSPNKLHHLYLQEWKAAYPEAQLWGPQSTIEKLPDIKFREALVDSPPAEWLTDIDQAWFRGSFAMDEIVFLHRPSATAIIADLIQTFSDHFLRLNWNCQRVIVAHGEWPHANGKAFLTKSFRWLGTYSDKFHTPKR
jgi:hypothetical protein